MSRGHRPVAVMPHPHPAPTLSTDESLVVEASPAWKHSDALAFLPSGTFPDPVLIFYATRCASSSSCRRQDCPPSSETKLLQRKEWLVICEKIQRSGCPLRSGPSTQISSPTGRAVRARTTWVIGPCQEIFHAS